MRSPAEVAPKARRKFLSAIVGAMVLTALATVGALTTARAQAPATQSPAVPQWQTDAGGKMEFDIISVKPNKSGFPPSGPMPTSNIPLGPQDMFAPTGGLLSATNWPLFQY